MIGRRRFLLAGAAAPLAPATSIQPAGSPPDRLAFRIVRNGSVIGSHILDFMPAKGGIDVRIAVDIAVGIGPITLFRYTLRGLEQWRDGAVSHAEATTNDDGDRETMRCDRDAGGLRVIGTKTEPYLAPAGALPATHWNIAELQGPWINIEDGRLFRPIVSPPSPDRVLLANGQPVEAERYELSGDVRLTIWYDTARQWCALTFAAHDGSVVHYERL